MASKLLKTATQGFSGRITRRDLLKGTGTAAFTGIAGLGTQASTAVAGTMRSRIPTYKSIGVPTLINCGGTFTALGGSIMPPDVVAAMVEASKNFVSMRELQAAAGKRMAELLGVESARVTAGCTAA
ncbi:twin-arginine translocation signal domain-containing protein, partial [Candidatus Latescibacterota bacterium]